MKKRFHLLLITVNATVLLLCGLFLFLFILNLLVDQTQKRGFADIEQIQNDLNDIKPIGETDFQKVALDQSRIISARIIIVDEDYNLLADSSIKGELIPGQYIDAAIMEAKEKTVAGDILRSVRTGELKVSIARKTKADKKNIIISSTYLIDDERKLIVFLGGFTLLLLLLVITLISVVISYILKRYKSPIRKLLLHTREAASGGFNKISINSGDNELNQLADEFNSLVDRYNFLVEEDNRKYSRINTLLSNLHTGILMVNNNLEVTLVNPEAEKLLNLNKLSLFNIRGIKALDNDSLNEILSKVKSHSDDEKTGKFSITEKSGTVLEIEIEIVRNKYIPYERSGYLIILRDVTEMRRLENLKDEFVANVSHELRTPLTVISGFVETLKSFENLESEDRLMALNIIEVETERLKKLIGELLLLSRIEGEMGHAKKRSINTLDAIEQVRTTLDPMATKKQISIDLEAQDSPILFYGVPGWFRQIAYNLYDNAIKYTPVNGKITIRLYKHNNLLILEVEDSGQGVPKKDRKRVFDRFYKKDSTGSGIGLTITKRIVSEFKGSIVAESGISGGALFRVEIPLE